MLRRIFVELLAISIIYVCVNSAAIRKKNPGRIQTYAPYTCYKCTFSECDNPYAVTCDFGYLCFTYSAIVDGGYLHREKGCHTHDFSTLVRCNGGISRKKRNDTSRIHTCCSGNLCNDDEFEMPSVPEPMTTSPAPEIEDKQMKIINSTEEIILTKLNLINLGFSACVTVFLTTLLIALVCFIFIKIRGSCMQESDLLPKSDRRSTANDTRDDDWTSGSGSGLPTLNQRSLSQDVTLIKIIGQGRYGEVWQGVMQGEYVAVKIFFSVDSASWTNEVNIYTNIALYHDHVLGFKGSTIASRLGVTEMWLLTAFHERGSLYDYLFENSVSREQMMLFVRSICSGLLHLHTEFFGSKGKPAIAHRDLKTKNILLTSHGTCVIADFGLAKVKSIKISSSNMPENYQVGTKRYMAPEVLDESIKFNSFESFKRTDIYAFGLMLWEVCSRCAPNGTGEAFRLAFDDCVPNNPDFEDMKKVVCVELKRPEIPNRWLSDEPLHALAKLMEHCWHKNPEIRYTAYRVKKTLDKINVQIQEQ